MRVRDLWSDVVSTLGKCAEETVFRRLSDAVRLLSNKGIFDPNTGCMDISVVNGCITLPPEVETILAANVGCKPTLVRDQWFQYHLNGVGSELTTDCKYTDVITTTSPVIREYSSPVKLVAIIEKASDNNTKLMVFGWDSSGNRIYSTNDAGETIDGFAIPTVYGFPAVASGVPAIAKIDRVEKAVTNGYVQLVAVDPDSTGDILAVLGNYQPTETDPSYVRIRISASGNSERPTSLRIVYKKRDSEIRSQNDWINLDNREAILLAVKAVKFRDANNFEQARAAETEAQRLLSEQANARRPATALSGPQIIREDSWDQECDRLHY